ncbi:MAG: SET domain-containing protein-lysine N-methyltransferase [Burkholderiales bacterium]|nr:SET domain-containing protein-lysine N-methyltransferase [Burkholderiales bacterium]
MTPKKKTTGSTRKSAKKQLKNNKSVKKSAAGKSTVKKALPKVAVRNSPIHGRGVFAVGAIAKGERIIEYTGERISHAEADRRYGELHEGSSHTMLFAATDEIVIDATKRGGPARWINHSCRPNCEADETGGRVFISSIRAIRAGEELSYDYNLVLEERHTPKLKREHPCHCGARNCRGTLLGRKR